MAVVLDFGTVPLHVTRLHDRSLLPVVERRFRGIRVDGWLFHVRSAFYFQISGRCCGFGIGHLGEEPPPKWDSQMPVAGVTPVALRFRRASS